MTGRTAAIVPAAGRGERLAAGLPKAVVTLAGVPLVVHAVRRLLAAPCVSEVVVAVPPGSVPTVAGWLAGERVRVLAGGAHRRASVAAALAVLGADVDVVVVHDAARPLAPPALVEAVTAAVRAGAAAAVPGLAVTDTVKRVDAAGRVLATVPRADLRAVQTPQAFDRAVLDAAHAGAPDDPAVTDDAALVERLGGVVLVLPGSEEAFKVTHPIDLLLAEALLDRRR